MKNFKMNHLWGMLAAFSLLVISSCGEEDAVPVPVAEFTTTTEGKTITFVNASTDGESYLWDFGDGNTSIDETPAPHTFTGNGSYVIKLTVTNASGDDESQAVVEIINITLDGDFTDWADVEAIPNSFTDGTTLKTIKIENLGNTKLFVYIEGTDELTPLMQIPMNLDNDTTTGAFIDWIYYTAGEDVLIEGALPFSDVVDAQYASIYGCEPCDGSVPGGWNWAGTPFVEVIADFMEASELLPVSGGLAFEFSIDLTAMGSTIASDGIGIGFLDISLDTWGPVSAIPGRYNENDNPQGTLYTYEFK